MFWVAGFDILYGLQDMEFDKKQGLYSIPKVFGIETSLWIARVFHLLTIVFLLSIGYLFELSNLYLIGVLIASGLMLYEHSLVKPGDLSKLDMAFFNMNGYISITVFIFTLFSYLIP